ncbi:Smok2b [Symbiodinium sp. CCMP2592]|nr:Smok2b [Symbiodinium sp. CCMP2592]
MASFGRGRGYAGGGGGFNSFSGVRLRANNRGRLDAEPADFDVDFSSSLEVDLGAGLGTGVQRDSFGFTSQSGNRLRGLKAASFQHVPSSSSGARPLGGVLQGLEQMPFDHQIRAMRWRGDGVCCFILAGSGGIDAFRASRVLPHLLHLSTLSTGHLSQADLSGFRACVLLADLMDWPASEENAPDLLSACKELASNGSAVAVVAVFLSFIPGGPDRDAASTAALQNAVLGAGADCVLFSCPTHPVTFRHLQTAIQGTEAWHERIAEAIESAQAKLARAQEQRWQRHYQIALRKIVWKAPQTVFPHIPQEDGDLQEREDGVGDCSFVRVIGSGAFGSVFLGRHPRLGDVAVKAIKKASIKNIFDLAKVERELSILMGVLDHPNVLQILSCLHSTNNLYIVMEFLGEYTLHTYLQLRQSGSARNVVMLPFQEVQSIFGDILKAIAHCHAAHVCHRDLKFKNMMIDANSRVTMVDFGLAVQVAPGQELHDSCGTVPFAAPEVMLCSPTKGYDGTVADTWSIAVCLVELLCGLGTVESIIGLTADDEANFEHIAQQCLLLCTDYVHQLVLSYAGKDVQGVHRNDLVKTMRGTFRENPKSRMSVRDIGALEAFSAKAGPLPKAKKHRSENDDDERSSWTQSQYSYPKSGGSGEGDETLSDLSVQDWIGAEADQGIRPVQPLLERIGGSQTVVKVVSTVYDWLLPRPEFGKFFLACPLKMGRIRAGISSFLTELLEDHGKVDLDMLSNVHWNLGVSDFLFTDFADALLEAFRTWGSRGDSAMAEIQASIEKLRLPITAGHRARLATAQTDRCPQEIVWLMSALGIAAEDFAQALSDLLTQDARLEACLNETEKRDEETNLATLHQFARTLWQGTIDAAMEVVFAGEQPLFQQDIGAVTLFCENVRQVLTETGLEDNDSKDMQVLMEHSGELVLNRARNARLVQPPSMAHDVQWFQKTMFDLCKADSYLQFFAESPKMGLCLQSIFKLIMNGGTPPSGASFSSKLRSAHQDLYLTDARYSAFLAQVDKVLRAMFPWPVHPAAVANSNIRSLEGFRTEVLCGSTLRSSRLQAVEGMLNAGSDSSKQRVARNARKGRVMAAMQRCAGKLFGAISSDSRVSVFFRNTDPACKDRKAKYLGCAMGGSLPAAVTPSHTTATPGTTSPSSISSANSLPVSPTSSLKQQHQLFRITDYHFDVFLDHVRTALGGEDPEAADLAPAQLENLRQHVVLTSRAKACPVSGNTASNGRACPFARRSNDGSAPLLDRVGGSEEIEKILAHMEREAASSSILVPFLQNQDELPCRLAIRNLLATAAAGDKLPEVDPQKLRDKHAGLQMLPEHREKWLSCFNKSMVAHILPPEVAEKLQTCFQSLVSSMVGPTEAEQEDDAEEDKIAEEKSAVDWGRLQGLMDELEGEKGLSKLIEAWYQRISEDPTINVFFTGTRPQVMMFQTRFWKKVLREGLEPDGRRQLQLINVHQHLRITHNHFDSFVRCLMLACDQLSLSQPSSNNMRAAVECFRPQIVSEN